MRQEAAASSSTTTKRVFNADDRVDHCDLLDVTDLNITVKNILCVSISVNYLSYFTKGYI